MFKKLYKSANDKISSEDAYARFAASLNGHRKRSIRPYITSAAALAACLTVTVFGIKLYDSRPNEAGSAVRVYVPQSTAVPDVKADDITDTPDGAADADTADIAQTPAPKAEGSTKKSAKTRSAKKSEQKEAAVPENSVQSETVHTDTAEPAVSENISAAETVPEPNNTAEMKKAADTAEIYGISAFSTDTAESADSADTFMAKSDRMSGAAAVRTLDEYNSFIGRDIRDGICVPDGMADNTAQSGTDGGWTYVYDGGGKHAEIKTSPAEIPDVDCGEANMAAQGAAYLIGENSDTARFSCGGIDFEVTAQGFTDEEFSALISSLQQ